MPMGLYIVWSPKWELGIPIIDEQHRGIISLINTLFYLIAGRRSEEVIIPLMRTLTRYWSLHRMTEEELLIASGYPQVKHHIEEHRGISAQLVALMKESIRNRGYSLVSDDLMRFLRKIQAEHFSGRDFGYVECVKSHFEEISLARSEEQDPSPGNSNNLFMPLHINWASHMELGISILDEQHRGMASLTNSLSYFVSGQKNEDAALSMIKAIERYWSLHCITEEELLIQCGYPRTESHLDRHYGLVGQLSSFIIKAAKSENKTEVLDALLAFIESGQVMHSHQEDRQFVPHLKKYLLSRNET